MNDDALRRGLAHHRAGRLAEAEAVYRAILASDPNHADALQLLGTIAHQVGQHGAAIELLQGIPVLNRDSDIIDWLADTFAAGVAIFALSRIRPARG